MRYFGWPHSEFGYFASPPQWQPACKVGKIRTLFSGSLTL